MNDPQSIDLFFARWDHFPECIVRGIQVDNHYTEVEIAVDYVWDANGGILETPLIVPLRFQVVQAFSIVNALNKWQVEAMERLDWGFDEFALIRISGHELTPVHPYSASGTYTRAEFVWEGDRRIEIVFKRLTVPDIFLGGPDESLKER